MKTEEQAASGGMLRRLRVGLVCFPDLRREGMAALLEGRPGDQVHEFASLTAEAALKTADLDLLMIDAENSGPLFSLLAALRQAQPHLRVLLVGPPVEHAVIATMISAGAKGYLFFNATVGETLLALAVVGDGSIWAPRKVLANLLDHALDSADDARRVAAPEPVVRFTVREREVLRLLVLGYPNREIAALLKVDDGTVKAHLSRLMRKAGVENRIALTMRAIERNWM